MATVKTLKKWWQVYSGDKEKRFFVGKDGNSGLCRHGEFVWRSTSKLSDDSGLSKEEVEEIISKYHKAGIVLQHAKDPEKWGYWELVAPSKGSEIIKSVGEADQDKRIDKATKKK